MKSQNLPTGLEEDNVEINYLSNSVYADGLFSIINIKEQSPNNKNNLISSTIENKSNIGKSKIHKVDLRK